MTGSPTTKDAPASVSVGSHPHQADGRVKVAVELDVPARMRDGVTLRANVYRPDGPGPWPTILTRTPYGKDLIDPLPRLDPVQAARQGFMVVIQDTRGRFASDGEWEPFRYERQDGFDSVEWAAKLPGSNGRVAMFGESYCGNTQWLAAVGQPPSLAAISPTFTWTEPMDGLFGRGGAVELGIAVPWSLIHNIDYLRRRDFAADELERRIWAIVDDLDRMTDDAFWQLPVHDLPALKRHGISRFGFLRAIDDPQMATWCRVAGEHAKVTVPTLHTAGWYDVFLQGTLDSYATMTELGRDARLVIGPWTHFHFADPVGTERFGLRASRYGVPAHSEGDINDLQLAWFRQYLEPGSEPVASQPPVRVFVMGRNVWRDETSWPPTRARKERWFLHHGGGLSTTPPASGAGTTEFSYDPANPVPTCGGATGILPAFLPGPFDQHQVEARTDVCVFTSEPLGADLEVGGRVRVMLHAQSSAPSTDWVARLCDVYADGRSMHICDGIVRVARDAQGRTAYEIDLWSTSIVFLRGHRVRVHITSSSFPRWDRNLNTGDQRGTRMDAARQRIFHDADHASYIELPIID